jgi:Pyruvate/2-oxoacid:ferredoxin oxidoreductase delta subunit
MHRKIVRIDEAKCDGCGDCITSCAEGAIALVGGKARLVSDAYCDGLGACLGECPQGAISVIERDAADFDEAAVASHLAGLGRPAAHPAPAALHSVPRPLAGARGPERPGACPGSAPRELPRRGLSVVRDGPGPAPPAAPRQGGSALGHWPVQLHLVSPQAPWLAGAHLLVAADCVPFAYAGFHADFLAGRALVIGCPKLDDTQAYADKLSEICARNDLASITVIRMEVPCCGGIAWAAREGAARSGKPVPIHDVVIGLDGSVRQAPPGG